jgi:Ca2+-transporting ATPase
MNGRHGWDKGLSSHEAAKRLKRDGENELPSAKPRRLLAIALDVVREPMFLLLIAAAAIYLTLGDLREALVLFASVFVVMAITFHQERKTERALEALRDLSSPRALVVRDGEAKLIAGREVVQGDVLMLKEGDRVPADALLLACNDLTVDESLLTGESVPVRKRAGEAGAMLPPPGGDDLPYVYSGTLLTQGHGAAQVFATGVRTEIGRIGKSLERLEAEPSPVQKETRRAVLLFAAIGLCLCVIVAVLYALTRHSWLNGLLAGITLAMAMLPEEIPVVLTVFLALGAWRISRQGVLTRRSPAIETLGETTVLCVDKTGTLTQNRMAVRRLWVAGAAFDSDASRPASLPEAFHDLLEFSILASEIEPFDPMERAYLVLAQDHLADEKQHHPDWRLVREYAFTPQLPAHAHIWWTPHLEQYVAAAKGAPEAMADLCRLAEPERGALLDQVASMAADGLRVLAIARAELPDDCGEGRPWPNTQHEIGFRLIGLTGLEDPIRPAVPAAIKECYGAGIRTVMVTGDYPGTAQAIARQIGLAPWDQVITGQELAGLSASELAARIRHVNIFARVVPEQKLRLVQAFKAAGEIVAMTGDGVNDAPALKAAHIGVAMGRRGTEVAREAASLVLLEDDFTSLVHAVRLGRRIFDNIQKAMRYILAVHVPTAGLSLLPLLFGWPLVFFPVHIVFLEFIIDPACSIAFEAEPAERDVMRRPPRPATSRLFGGWMVASSVLQGLGVLVATATLYGWVLAHDTIEGTARAMAFTTIVLGNLGLIFSNRSHHAKLIVTLRRPNPPLWWIVGGTLLALALVLIVAPLRDMFQFAPMNLWQLLACLVAAALGLAWFEVYKVLNRPQPHPVRRPS